VLSQPPHQQRFSFGHGYDPISKSFVFKLRQLYTSPKSPSPEEEWPSLDIPSTSPPNMLAASKIDSGTRVLKTAELAAAINKGI